MDVRPVDINASDWDCTLEQNTRRAAATANKTTWGFDGPALRLGFRQITGMREVDALRIVEAQQKHGSFVSIAQVQQVAKVDIAAIHRLVKADALASIQLNRRQGTWAAMGLSRVPAPLFDHLADVPAPRRPFFRACADEEVVADYANVGLSLKAHPVSFARAELNRWHVRTAADIQDADRFPAGKIVRVAGLVLVRQRPGTASGVVFVTLEDETGVVNLILWSSIYERYRTAARHATLLQANGIIQREGKVIHVLVRSLIDRTPLLSGVSQRSRDFH